LAKRHRDVLAKLDSLAVARYQITEKDLQTIERYLMESDIGVVLVEENKLADARRILAELKGETNESA
jgi:hypothetical protein